MGRPLPRLSVWLLPTAILVTAVGCGPNAATRGKGPANPAAGSMPLRVAMVTDAGGIDDRSFNASSWAGLKRAKADLGIEARTPLETREQGDYQQNLETLAVQGNDLVLAVGYLMEDALKSVAPRHKSTKFVIIDGSAPDLPNCCAVKFREEEGSFLAGYLAGRMTKTGALGFVGGMEGPIIKRFEAGYRAGARTARPDIRVIAKYLNSWTDVPKGKEFALACFSQGADIVFHATGKAGLGVLDAAAEKGPGYYGIGVDSDQDGEHPGRVLTSMMKGVDSGVYAIVKELKAGKWQPGDHVFGLKDGGVHLSPMKYTHKDVPAEVLQKLDALSRMISAGQLKVPSTEEEVQNYVPPAL
jgi:basic membrane protein A and related proteins